MTTSARRFLERGVIRQQLTNICLVILYLLGMKPENLKKWYERRPEKGYGLGLPAGGQEMRNLEMAKANGPKLMMKDGTD